MADLFKDEKEKSLSLYKDRRYNGNPEKRETQLRRTTTLYVGNLSFYTTEEQIFDLFSKVGEIRRIIMGLDRYKKTPCGFCFVEYYRRCDAEKCVNFVSGTRLDERLIRVDYDAGFSDGRQYGRGRSGGQVRDEHRVDYDPGRGGFGKAAAQTGMSGMEMWGNNNFPRGISHADRPFRGRGRGRGQGRGRGRGRGRGHVRGRWGHALPYGPPPIHHFSDPMSNKRPRPPDMLPPPNMDQNLESANKRQRIHNQDPRDIQHPQHNGPGHSDAPHRSNDVSDRMHVDGHPVHNEMAAPESEPVRNAKFDRGKEDE